MPLKLRPKLILAVLGPLAVVLALFAYLQYNVQYNLLLDGTIRTVTDLNDVIEGSLQYAMLTRNRVAVQASIDDITANFEVTDLFLLNREATVRAGFPRAVLDRQLSKSDGECAVCHAPGAPHRGEFTVILTLPNRGRVLRSCRPIENKPACYRCHDATQRYNGVLITDLSLTNVDQQAKHNLQQTLLLLGSALFLGAALLGVTMERAVIQPLSQLIQVIRDLNRGNLRRRVESKAEGDEINELARTFNHMADSVYEKAHLEQQLHQRTAELESLYRALQAKEAMRAQLLKRTIAAQEEERARLSRELHDEIGQGLTAIQLGVERLARTLSAGDTTTREQLVRVQMLIATALTGLRRVIGALRPGVLDQLGLVPAVGWVADHTLRPLGLQVTIETSGLSGRLPAELEVILFRIAQEAMNNVARHSQASHLTIRLEQTQGQVIMTLADDGVGFDLTSVTIRPAQRRGVGLVSMQERAALAGGQVRIESAPRCGTQIQAVVPVPILKEQEAGERN